MPARSRSVTPIGAIATRVVVTGWVGPGTVLTVPSVSVGRAEAVMPCTRPVREPARLAGRYLIFGTGMSVLAVRVISVWPGRRLGVLITSIRGTRATVLVTTVWRWTGLQAAGRDVAGRRRYWPADQWLGRPAGESG